MKETKLASQTDRQNLGKKLSQQTHGQTERKKLRHTDRIKERNSQADIDRLKEIAGQTDRQTFRLVFSHYTRNTNNIGKVYKFPSNSTQQQNRWLSGNGFDKKPGEDI